MDPHGRHFHCMIDPLAFMWFTLPNKVIKTSMIANCFIKYSQGKFASKHQTRHFFQCEWLKLGNNMCIQKNRSLNISNSFCITTHHSSPIFSKKNSPQRRGLVQLWPWRAPLSKHPAADCHAVRVTRPGAWVAHGSPRGSTGPSACRSRWNKRTLLWNIPNAKKKKKRRNRWWWTFFFRSVTAPTCTNYQILFKKRLPEIWDLNKVWSRDVTFTQCIISTFHQTGH